VSIGVSLGKVVVQSYKRQIFACCTALLGLFRIATYSGFIPVFSYIPDLAASLQKYRSRGKRKSAFCEGSKPACLFPQGNSINAGILSQHVEKLLHLFTEINSDHLKI
jgi:hypothetical protein